MVKRFSSLKIAFRSLGNVQSEGKQREMEAPGNDAAGKLNFATTFRLSFCERTLIENRQF